MLSDTDVEKCVTDMEEGKIGEGSEAAAAEGSGESLARVKTDPRDVIKPRTCFIGWSLMTVDSVFWYIKHVHYTLVWICLWN
jgi:hypothetical protein